MSRRLFVIMCKLAEHPFFRWVLRIKPKTDPPPLPPVVTDWSNSLNKPKENA